MLSAQQISNMTLIQLGGRGRLESMIGAKNFSYDVNGALSFHFKGCRKANMVRITLNNDTYTLDFAKYHARTLEFNQVASQQGIYVSELVSAFERFTGLFLTLQ